MTVAKNQKPEKISENYVEKKEKKKKKYSSFTDWMRPNPGSHEEGFSEEIKPNQNTIYQSLLQLSTKNNFVM